MNSFFFLHNTHTHTHREIAIQPFFGAMIVLFFTKTLQWLTCKRRCSIKKDCGRSSKGPRHELCACLVYPAWFFSFLFVFFVVYFLTTAIYQMVGLLLRATIQMDVLPYKQYAAFIFALSSLCLYHSYNIDDAFTPRCKRKFC